MGADCFSLFLVFNRKGGRLGLIPPECCIAIRAVVLPVSSAVAETDGHTDIALFYRQTQRI